MDTVRMSRIVGGKRYATKTATLIAHDVYWDGHNFERDRRNAWLYRTRMGAYFLVTGTFWQGERDNLRTVTVGDARQFYEGQLSEHEVRYAQAFPDVTIENA